MSILYPKKCYQLPMRRALRKKLEQQDDEQQFPVENEPAFLVDPEPDNPGDIFT